MHINAEDLIGKTIASVEDAGDRGRYGDDPGFIITFTDGSKFAVEAGMGQGAGYLVETFTATRANG